MKLEISFVTLRFDFWFPYLSTETARRVLKAVTFVSGITRGCFRKKASFIVTVVNLKRGLQN